MAFTAEFAGAEFAAFEFARDPVTYLDIQAASSLAVVASASGGRIAQSGASATFGVTPDVDYSRLVWVYGTETLSFVGALQLAAVVTRPASATLGFSGYASGGKIIAASAAGSFEFVAQAEPVIGEGNGSAYWRFVTQASGGAVAGFTGLTSLYFDTVAWGQALRQARGQTTLSFGHQCFGVRVQAGRGSGIVSFLGASRSRRVVIAFSQELQVFTTGATGASKVRAKGSATLQAAAAAVGGSAVVSRSAATAQWRFSAPAVGAALAQSAGAANLAHLAVARAGMVVSGGATGSLAFQSVAKSGVHLVAFLPAARNGFIVPARAAPFVVPPEPDLQEV